MFTYTNVNIWLWGTSKTQVSSCKLLYLVSKDLKLFVYRPVKKVVYCIFRAKLLFLNIYLYTDTFHSHYYWPLQQPPDAQSMVWLNQYSQFKTHSDICKWIICHSVFVRGLFSVQFEYHYWQMCRVSSIGSFPPTKSKCSTKVKYRSQIKVIQSHMF